MPKGGILYLIMVFAPWEAIIKYNVLSPMGVFVLGGIYQSLVWQNNNINIAVQSCEVMKQSTDITVHNHIGLQHSSWSSSITYSHCNHLSLSEAGSICNSH